MKRKVPWWNLLWLVLGSAYFLIPLLATAQFSLQTKRNHYGFEAYGRILRDPLFRSSLAFSFKLAVFTVIIALCLLVPTAYWVHLKLPRLRPVVEFLTILPFVVPAIVLVVGLLGGFRWTPTWFYGGYLLLVAGYVILAYPYVYRSLDAGLRAMDVHTLTEAALSLGAPWRTVLFRVIVPNLRVSILASAFLTVAIVMGEFTMSVLMQFTTFAVYINYVGATQATGAAALSLLSFAITWIAMLGILLLGRRPGVRQVQIGGRTDGTARAPFRHETLRDAGGARRRHARARVGRVLLDARSERVGKTTALRIVAGFEIPDAGQVLLDDVDITGVPPNKRDMGMVFQAYSLFPNLTARENVEFGLRVRGRGQTDRATRANELLELVGLGQHGDRYSHQLSGGQQQRVALARALAIQPRVLLMDEPLSALDAQVRVQLREEIRRIQTELGITALYVTHDQEEALSISDRVAVMARGRPEQIGVPAEIYREPATPFVAEFVGTTNRFEATVVEGSAVLHEGNGLSVTAANGRPKGQRILVLVRPESLSVIAAGDGGASREGGLAASVTAQVFLGPVTRLKMVTPDGTPVAADVSSAAAARFQVGDSVIARFDADDARVLDLPSV